jgi:signal transduction histidine kinase
LFTKKDQTKRGFSPIYLAILSAVLLIILIINGLLEINRTRKGFYLLLEREAIILLQHYEKNIQEVLASLQVLENHPRSFQITSTLSDFFVSLEESMANYLLGIANEVDRMDGEKSLGASDLQSLIDSYLISSIEIFDARGNLLRGWPSQLQGLRREPLLRDLVEEKRSISIDLFGRPITGKNPWFSIAIRRKSAPGMIALHLSGEKIKSLFRVFAIQRAISDMTLREGILYVSVQDAHLMTLAHTNPAFIGKSEEDPFLKNAIQSRSSLRRLYPSTQGEEIFEVLKPFSFEDRAMGLIRIGFSPKDILPVLRQIKKSVALSILFFLVLGVFAITFIWVNQNRHLRRIKEMEDRIHLAERLSSLGHLAAGVAHEIRNPLNAIGMGLQRLKREFSPQDLSQKEEYTSFTDLIFKEIRRVNEIINQFLTLARPFQLDLRLSSLEDLLKNLITLFHEEASSQKIQIQAEIDSTLPPIPIDPERLTQALINIMKNAIQAMTTGGSLRIETKSFKDQVEVTFSDTGSGIPPDQMEKIFNYYYTTKEDGVGLGLPIAHRIIEAHGGQLKLESQPGVGTKVTITLPLQQR